MIQYCFTYILYAHKIRLNYHEPIYWFTLIKVVRSTQLSVDSS